MNTLLDVLVAVVFGVILAVLFAEWAAGCGETYVDAKGVHHQNQCLFSINLRKHDEPPSMSKMG